MLYPKEDKENRVLLYACRNCEHVEQADLKQIDKDGYEVQTGAAWRIYRNEITQKPVGGAQIFHEVITDPTLPRTKGALCEQCGGREAVFFQANSGNSEQVFTLFFVCCSPGCGNSWTE
jgi:DNA-directed RNA polymerase II subunit RPB9